VLSHFSAARRWRLDVPDTGEAWVTVPNRRTPTSAPGFRVVRSRHLPSSAIRRVDGIPVLEPSRTIADLSRFLDVRSLTAVALAAMQRNLCTHADLAAWQGILAGAPGMADLRAALRVADPRLESILAAEFGQLMTCANVPLLPGYRLRLPDGTEVLCDFADPLARIDFEVDGFAYHSSPAQVAADKARDRRLMRGGWITVRYDTDSVRRHPKATIADARDQIARRMAAGL
jgi:very-short-patch-repair endonuclease